MLPTVVGNAIVASLSGLTSDPAPVGALVREVEVQFDSGGANWQQAVVASAAGNANQTWSYAWLLPAEDGVAHTVRFRATDHGNNMITTNWYTTVVDTVAPIITVTQQLTQVVQGSSTPVLAGLVTDGGGLNTGGVQIQPPSSPPLNDNISENNGQWSYTLNQPPGLYKLFVTFVDTAGNSRLIGPFAVEVMPFTNTPPVAIDDSAATAEDTAVMIDVLANDSDADGDTLTIDSVTQGANGSVVNNGSNVTYTPNSGFSGSDSFTYANSDGHGGTAMATVTVMVALVNSAPVSGPYSVNEGDSVLLDASGTTDAEQDPVTLTYAWDFDSDGLYDDATGIMPTFAALTSDGPMDVTVALQVTDAGGLVHVDTALISVLNVAPTITAVKAPIIIYGEVATITITASDPIDALSYAFDCDNDGSYEVGPQAALSTTCFFAGPVDFTVNVQVSDDDAAVTSSSTLVTVISQQQAVADLQDNVQTLVDSGALSRGQGRELSQILVAAIKKLNQGKPQAAIEKLVEFVETVNDFILDGVLTPAEGQPLLDAAERIIAAIAATDS